KVMKKWWFPGRPVRATSARTLRMTPRSASWARMSYRIWSSAIAGTGSGLVPPTSNQGLCSRKPVKAISGRKLLHCRVRRHAPASIGAQEGAHGAACGGGKLVVRQGFVEHYRQLQIGI